MKRVRIYLKITKLAWRNVLRNWRHSLATLLAIAFGFTAVSLFDGFIKEIKRKINDDVSVKFMMGNVVVQRAKADVYQFEDQWKFSMTAQEQQFIENFLRKDPAFRYRNRRLQFTGMLSSDTSTPYFLGYSYDIDEGTKIRGENWSWNAMAGMPLHLSKEPVPIQVGQGLGKLIGCEPSSTRNYFLSQGNYVAEKRPFSCENKKVNLTVTTESAQTNSVDMTVVGIVDGGLRELDQHLINLPLEEAQRLLDTDKINSMSVKLASDDDTEPFIQRMRAAIASSDFTNLEVIPWQKHSIGVFFEGADQILSIFRNMFMVIIVIIGVLSVSNTMKKSVNERIREIGTLRSIGFFRRHLVSMFSMEALFLSVIACALGLAMTIGLSELIGAMGFTYRAGITAVPVDLKILYAPTAWLVSGVLLTLLATVTGWYCSLRANYMVIADAMRHVE